MLHRPPARLLAILTIASLAAAVPTAAASPPAPAPAAAPIDLAHPEAGITDPAGGMAAVPMRCTAGQVDLNHASVTQIGTRLGLARPIAERVIEARPYLRSTDLEVVAGIGPGRLRQIEDEGSSCATPPTLPPPAGEACTDATKVDVQTASISRIQSGLGLARPIAERLVATRPIATRRHLTRVSGIGPGRLPDVLARSCLTPAPIATATTEWRWGTGTTGGLVERDGFQLAVPPGRITAPAGAWLSITPLPDDPGPTADLHVSGLWTGEVAVTLPRMDAALLPSGWTDPVVLHQPDAWDLLWSGSALHDDGTGLTIATTTLSPYTSAFVDPTVISLPGAERPMTQLEWINHLNERSLAPFTPPAETELPGCDDTGRVVTNAFIPAEQISCSSSLVAGRARWTVTNATGDTLAGLAGEGAVANLYFDGPIAIVSDRAGDNALLALATDARNRSATAAGGDGFTLTPGASITFELGPSTTGRLVFQDDALGTVVNYVFAQAMAFVTKATPSPAQVAGIPAQCVASVYATNGGRFDGRSIADCVLDQAETAIQLTGQAGTGTPLGKIATGIKVAKWFTLALDALSGLADLQGFDGTHVDVQHRYVPPPSSGGGLGGRVGPLGGPDGTLPADAQALTDAIGRFPSGSSYLVTSGEPKVAYGITVGGDYLCFAQQYPVRDNLSTGSLFWTSENSTPAHCEPGPNRVIPLNATNWVLRRGDTPASYLLDATGHIRAIPDGGCYLALANRYLVLDRTSQAEIDKFPTSSQPACG